MRDADEQRLAIGLRRVARRRLLLSSGAALAGTAFSAHGLAAGIHTANESAHRIAFAPATPAAPEAASLSAAELDTLRAVVGRLIPSDVLGPGADVAGVHIFIDRGLAGPNARYLALFQAVLAALDEDAGGKGFAASSLAEQDALLTKLEAGTLPHAPDGGFALLLEQTREGMFGDPVYGGNQDFVGWDLIGYPGIKLLWTEADQAIDAEVKAAHTSVAQFGGKGW